jgi:hypothetical protein
LQKNHLQIAAGPWQTWHYKRYRCMDWSSSMSNEVISSRQGFCGHRCFSIHLSRSTLTLENNRQQKSLSSKEKNECATKW